MGQSEALREKKNYFSQAKFAPHEESEWNLKRGLILSPRELIVVSHQNNFLGARRRRMTYQSAWQEREKKKKLEK